MRNKPIALILLCMLNFSNSYANEAIAVVAPQNQPVKAIGGECSPEMECARPAEPGRKAEQPIAEDPMEAGPLSSAAPNVAVKRGECSPGTECARPEELGVRKINRNEAMIAAVVQAMKKNPDIAKKRQPVNTGIDQRFQNLARPE